MNSHGLSLLVMLVLKSMIFPALAYAEPQPRLVVLTNISRLSADLRLAGTTWGVHPGRFSSLLESRLRFWVS
jgi:hypothetical protein